MARMNRNIVHARLGSRAWVPSVRVLALPLVLAMIAAGCAQGTQFRITNATGEEVAVTSAHTKKTISIPKQKAALVPHTSGDISVRLPDGTTWVYRNLSPLELKGTPFAVEKHYWLFGVQDGDLLRGLLTANLLLNKDGRLYAVPPDAKDVDEKLKQPRGFPVKPEEVRDAKNSAPGGGKS